MVFKDINIKIYTCYFFNDIINIEEFDPNNIKTDKKSNEKKIIFYIAYVIIKDPNI